MVCRDFFLGDEALAAKRVGYTNFFQRQEFARRTTVRLLGLFGLVFLFLAGGTYFLLLFGIDVVMIFVRADPEFLIRPLVSAEHSLALQGHIFALALLITAGWMGGGALTKMYSLRQGGSSVAEALGAREVNGDCDDPFIRRYVNVVEEMSLASGVPVPRIYVLRDQPGINGFAAGLTINDAAIAVTAGALTYLNREELQALVAHEFSHILHGDMRLNVRLIGMLHGVLNIYLTGRTFLDLAREDLGRTGRSMFRPTGATDLGGGVGLLLAIPGAFLMMIGIGGLLGSRFIKAGISRQREFLADASAVQFTRNPAALASALKKIGGAPYGSTIRGPQAEQISHMCFGEAHSNWLTHPPLEERILALDPDFHPDQGFDVLTERDARQSFGMEMGRERSGLRPAEVGADDVVGQIGTISPEYLAYCASLLAQIPTSLMEARGSLAGAVATAYLLFLGGNRENKRAQAEIISSRASTAVAHEAQRLWPVVRELDERLRLPLIDLIFPTLRQMTPAQFEEFRAIARALISVDGSVDFREFILEQLVLHRLEDVRDVGRGKSAQFHSFSGVRRDIENILSAVAQVGAQSSEGIQRAFARGKNALPSVVAAKIEFRDASQWNYEQLGASMARVARSSMAIKQSVIEAAAHCVMADGEVRVGETELLRAICDLMDSPLPPIVPVGHHRRKRDTGPAVHSGKEVVD